MRFVALDQILDDVIDDAQPFKHVLFSIQFDHIHVEHPDFTAVNGNDAVTHNHCTGIDSQNNLTLLFQVGVFLVQTAAIEQKYQNNHQLASRTLVVRGVDMGYSQTSQYNS
jgi:hypothetical protein